MTRVEVLDDDDARIVAELPVDLAVPDVEGDDPDSAALQQDVGEAARGRADIERLASVDRNTEGVQRVGELDPAAAHVGMIGRDDGDSRRWLDLGAGLCVRLPVDTDLAGEDQRACPFTGWREAPFDDELIQSNTQILQP